MAWTDSKVFRQWLADSLANAVAFDLSGAGVDTFKVPLYTGAITPDNDVSAANSAYNVGQWATANEQFEAGQWAQGGATLSSPALDVSVADVVFWDATDTASGATADLTSVVGCEVYDDTLTPKAGVCYNYFGGAGGSTVVNGTFTVVWAGNGIWRATL